MIQCYCLVQVLLDPSYQPLLKFYIANIAHDAYLGQSWLKSIDDITIDWISGNVHLKSDISIQGVWKKEKQLNLTSACQLKKAMKNNQVFLGVIHAQEPSDKLPPFNLKVQDLLNEYINVFPNELPKDLPPEQMVDHHINLLPDSIPVSKPTYQMLLTEMDELHHQLDDLLSQGFIHPSSLP